MVGEKVGHYRILKKLATGSTGSLFVAEDLRDQGSVILKVLSPGPLADGALRQVIIRENAAAAFLDHPHVVRNLGIRDVEGHTLIVYEQLDGEPLTGVMARGPASERQVLTLARQMLDGLETAHRQGLLHGDICPDNILIDGRGNGFLVGFGLGKSAERFQRPGKPGQPAPQFPAPEHVEKGRCDERSDMFSLGVVLYQWLTGALPFSESEGDARSKTVVREAAVSPGRRVQEISPGTEALLLRALKRDPAHRFQTAKDMRSHVDVLLEQLGPVDADLPGETPRGAGIEASPGFVRRNLWVIAAVTTVIVVMLVAWMLPRRESPPTTLQPGVALVQVTDWPGIEIDPCISSDGSRIVFASDTSGNLDLWVLDLDGGEPVRITRTPEAEGHPSWSPDGTEIVYCLSRGEGGIRALSLADGAVRELSATGCRPSWSPVSDAIVFDAMTRAEKPRLWIISSEGEMMRQLTRADDSEETHADPHWSPDGEQVVYERALGGENNIWVVSLDSRVQRRLSYPPQWDFDPFWDPLGKWIYFCSGLGDSIHIHRTLSAGGRRFQMTREAGTYSGLSTSGDGRRIVFSTMELQSRLWRAEARRGLPERVEIGRARTAVPDISPEGTRMVVPYRDRHSWDLCLVQGNTVTPIALGTEDEIEPRWSPDGQAVAFVERYAAGTTIKVTHMDGSDPRSLVTEGENFEPRWSPDGRWLAFIKVHSPQRKDIWIVDVGTGRAEPVTRAGMNTKPRWSPDGSQILFHSQGDTWSGLYAVVTGGGVVPRWVAEGKDGSWSADGRGIFYAGGEPGREDIWVLNLDEMSSRRLTSEEAGYGAPVPSPDGRMVAFLADRYGRPDVWVLPLGDATRDVGPRCVAEDTNLAGSPSWSPDGRWLYFTKEEFVGGDIWMYEME